MDSVVIAPKNKVYAHELMTSLEYYLPKIKVLSLDCFDTLLWRLTETPADVFFEIQQKPAFRKLNFNAWMRQLFETRARQKKLFVRDGKTEVKLKDIYLAGFPELTTKQLQSLAKDELKTELELSYALPPFVALIRKAYQLGLKIIIVSDTYFEKKELQCLLKNALPLDVFQMISQIFCSSEYGQSKGNGLFPLILAQLKLDPTSILHIGDNPYADYEIPSQLNLNAMQFIHHRQLILDILRMQGISGNIIDASIRHTRACHRPFRGFLAAAQFDTTKPESTIGYLSLGPIMYGFRNFIVNEIECLKEMGKKPKVLFLMRDAYLSWLVCDETIKKDFGKIVRISRFAAFASSFCTKEDVDQYLNFMVPSGRFDEVCKQLLIPEGMAKTITKAANNTSNPQVAFIDFIQQPKILQIIFNNSTSYRIRLKRYLEKEIALKAGDTLLFVDVGYTGTAQTKLAPVLKKEMNIEILGRYFIAAPSALGLPYRAGFIDNSFYDVRILSMFVYHSPLFEKLFTASERSGLGYDEEGNPIYDDVAVSEQQAAKLKAIQLECVRFVKEADEFFREANVTIPLHMLRDTTVAELGRLLFLPLEEELNYLKSFHYDVNCGAKDLVPVFDLEKGLLGLRKRGFFFMERNIKTMRTNYAAEIRAAGLDLAITLMAHHRMHINFRATDFSYIREKLKIIITGKGQQYEAMYEALPTYEGYFALLVPLQKGKSFIGIQFGLHYKWVQLEHAELISNASLYTQHESEHTTDISHHLAIDHMKDRGGGLFECTSKAGLVVLVVPDHFKEGNHTLRIIFRPLVKKDKEKEITMKHEANRQENQIQMRLN